MIQHLYFGWNERRSQTLFLKCFEPAPSVIMSLTADDTKNNVHCANLPTARKFLLKRVSLYKHMLI